MLVLSHNYYLLTAIHTFSIHFLTHSLLLPHQHRERGKYILSPRLSPRPRPLLFRGIRFGLETITGEVHVQRNGQDEQQPDRARVNHYLLRSPPKSPPHASNGQHG
jgi:hypothetical protein